MGSLTANELLAQLRDQGIRFRVDGESLVIDAPSEALTPELRSELAEYKAELLNVLRAELPPGESPIPSVPRDGPLPLSFSQLSMWLRAQLDPESPALNEPEMFRLKGRLNVEALRWAYHEVVKRHEILRACFEQIDGEVRQWAPEDGCCEFEVVDLTGRPTSGREPEARELAGEMVHRPFQLDRGSLMRALLLKLSSEEYLLAKVYHHIVIDGWSSGVLHDDLARCYRARVVGEPVRFDHMPIQYADFAVRQRQIWHNGAHRSELEYWREELADAPTLRLGSHRNGDPDSNAASHFFTISPKLTEALSSLSRAEGVTLFVTLLAAYQLFLGRQGGSDTFCVGVPVAGRDDPQMRGVVGPVANMLALRADLSGNVTVRTLLKRVQRVVLAGYSNAALPWEKLVEVLRPSHSRSYHPIIQAMFSFQNQQNERQQLTGLSTERIPIARASSLLDLNLFIRSNLDGFGCEFTYSTDIFSGEVVQQMAQDFQAVLLDFTRDPGTSIGSTAPAPSTAAGGGDERHHPSSPPDPPEPSHRDGPPTAAEATLLNIWQEVLERSDIGVHDNFFELGGHSLLAVDLMSRIHQATGKQLPISALFETPSVAAQAERLHRVDWRPKWTSLTPIQPHGNRAPLVLIPPAGGTVLRFAHMIEELGADQPVYALEPLGLDGDTEPHTTVEAMAAHYIAELRMARPRGPYVIGGICFGAHIALEMAQRLTAAGEEIPILLLFGPGRLESGSGSERQSLWKRARQLIANRGLSGVIDPHFLQRIRREVRQLLPRTKRRITQGVIRLRRPKWARYLRRHQIAAARAYRARPYPGRIVLLESEQVRASHVGWMDLAGDRFDRIQFDGLTHRDLLQGKSPILGETVAEILRAESG